MSQHVQTAAVLGAGVMGTAIAAHLAGAGVRTHLLDRAAPEAGGATPRHALASAAIERALQMRPAAFFDPAAAHLVIPGTFEDDLDKLAGCDLVIEAIVERLDAKQALFNRIAPHLAPHALVASNTSGLSVAEMSAGLPKELATRFVVMHFFNPVRYMRLLELVPGPSMSAASMARAAHIGELLGKGVVYAKDTPNFIANRIGIYSMMQALASMADHHLSFEEVDKIAGPTLGRAKSAAFRTADVVGLDTFVHVAEHCHRSLPQDEAREIFRVPSWLSKLVAAGNLGQKSGAGFYKKVGSDILVLEPETGAYRPQKKVRFESLGEVRHIDELGARVRALVAHSDHAGKWAWQHLARVLTYAAHRLGEISDDIPNIDRAMCWGFGWQMGPFELWDALGVRASVARMQSEQIPVPAWVQQMLESGQESFYGGSVQAPSCYQVAHKKQQALPQAPEQLRLAALHEQPGRVLKDNLSASLIDLGMGCLCLEVHTKMNTLDADVISMLHEAVTEAETHHRALVIANDGEHFGAGANLMFVYMAAQQGAWGEIEKMVRAFQGAMQRLASARVPVVAAPFQYTFGGAAEMAMAATACQAHAETYMGLVEVGVGLVPAGGGCLRLLERFAGPLAGLEGADSPPAIGAASLQIATAKVSTGAHEARRLRYLRPSDGISLNRSHQLAHAKARALGLAAAGHTPALPEKLPALGWDAAQTIAMRVWTMREGGHASEHDALIANKVAHILCGGKRARNSLVDAQQILDLECEAFTSLCGEAKTQARMHSILMNNQPLRN